MGPRPTALVLGLLGLAASTGAAQMREPDTLRNIKVLPSTMTPREVVNVMRGFTAALGVRCDYCHVGQEGRPLDFPNDDKRTKRVARVMLRMVQEINTRLQDVPERPTPNVTVTCATCHHGQSRPRTIQDVIGETLASAGADSAARAYRGLRERFYGRWTYDFGEQPLTELAMSLAQAGKYDDAVAIANLNLEFYPNSGATYMTLGETALMRADTAGAIARFRQALEKNPQDFRVRQRLRQLGVN